MKIVIIDKEGQHKGDGMEVYSERFSSFLKSKNHEVNIIRYTKRKKQPGIYPLPYYIAEKRSIVLVPHEQTMNRIKKYLNEIKPDIVYAYIPLSPLDFFLPNLCHELNIPIVGIWHSELNETANAFSVLFKSVFLAYLPYVKSLDRLHVFTDKLKTFYVKHGLDKERIFVLPNGINPSIYKPGKSKFKSNNNIKRGILFLGRMTLQKNPETLIKSFLSLDSVHKDTKLVMVGHGDLYKYLIKTYKHPKIIFTGAIMNEKEKVDIIRSCNVFVLPSRIEGMPFALLEAMSCGLACIASDAGANKSLMKDTGITLKERSIHQVLPSVLRIVLDYPEFAKILGNRARKKILKEYAQNKIYPELMKELINTKKIFVNNGPPIH